MENKNSYGGGGIGFAGCLTSVFITLRLLGKIDWSWWWVLSPLWIGFALAIALVCLVFGFWAVAQLLKEWK